MSRASSLYRLQELDLELEASKNRIEAIEAELSDDEAMKKAQELVEKSEQVLTAARSANLAAEHAFASQQEKIKTTESRLYGGSVTNPKELQDLQQESQALKRYLETLEERLLEAMLELDEAQQDAEQARQSLNAVEARQIEATAQLRGELSSLKDKVERLKVEREAAVGDVDRDDLKTYEHLRGFIGEYAVVLMRSGSCSACGVDLGNSQQQEVRNNEVPFACPQCGRILYAG
jgi:predicted  nucleic acid-binding Zn-ribbon protein